MPLGLDMNLSKPNLLTIAVTLTEMSTKILNQSQ